MNSKPNELSQRLRLCAKKVGSGNELARLIDVSRRTLENWLQGESEPKASYLASIAVAASVSTDWLLLGVGSPEGEEQTDELPNLDELTDRLKFTATRAGGILGLSKKSGISLAKTMSYVYGMSEPGAAALAAMARAGTTSADWILGTDDMPAAQYTKPASSAYFHPDVVKLVVEKIATDLQKKRGWKDIKPNEIRDIVMMMCNVVNEEVGDEAEAYDFERYSKLIDEIVSQI